MILCVVIEGALSSARWDAVVERVHNCTPLIVVARHGRLFAGIDDLDGLRSLVRRTKALAALAPDRTSALLCALNGTAGRLDAHADAKHVPIGVLMRLPELVMDERDAERLRLFGIRTIGDLQILEERHLRVQFGTSGSKLHAFLGQEFPLLPLYVPPPDIISRERFEDVQCEPGVLESALLECCVRALAELMPRLCWRVELAVLDKADETCAQRSRVLREGATTLDTIMVHARSMLRELQGPTRLWWGLRLRLASLTLPTAIQTQLFVERKTTADVSLAMMPRYSAVMKRVEILDPWSIVPESYARIIGYMPDRAGNV
ncbi:MAG: hypothetical protein IPP80_00770 [Ignavibacteria bacterium]|nr:hypothetical protein [Ignavibacteria bacterium]